jgi:translation initiation factor 1
MSRKKRNKNSGGGMVYSTNDSFEFEESENIETPAPNEQLLHVRKETKQRGGKTVTLIEGFEGAEEDGKELCKMLKQKCGTGGSYKHGEMIVQGNEVEKIKKILKDAGYGVK